MLANILAGTNKLQNQSGKYSTNNSYLPTIVPQMILAISKAKVTIPIISKNLFIFFTYLIDKYTPTTIRAKHTTIKQIWAKDKWPHANSLFTG